jgi:hypothetical protein
MSRKTFLAVTAATLAMGALASTSASAGFRPGHFPSSAGTGFKVLRPHFPSATNFTRPHFPSAANFIRPHFPLNRFSNIRLPHPGFRPFRPGWYPGYRGGAYAVYQGGGYAPAPAYVAPAPAYVAPAPSYTPPSSASCLSKTYQQDGTALFTDSCTGEQAVTAAVQTGS